MFEVKSRVSNSESSGSQVVKTSDADVQKWEMQITGLLRNMRVKSVDTLRPKNSRIKKKDLDLLLGALNELANVHVFGSNVDKAIELRRQIVTIVETFRLDNVVWMSSRLVLGATFLMNKQEREASDLFKEILHFDKTLSSRRSSDSRGVEKSIAMKAQTYIDLIELNMEKLPDLIKICEDDEPENKSLRDFTLERLPFMVRNLDEYTPQMLKWMDELLNRAPQTGASHPGIQFLQAEKYLKMYRFDLVSVEDLLKEDRFSEGIRGHLLKMQKTVAIAILHWSKPKLHLPASQWRMCQFCNRVAKRKELGKCSGCKMVRYCDEECQLKDWPSHKECC